MYLVRAIVFRGLWHVQQRQIMELSQIVLSKKQQKVAYLIVNRNIILTLQATPSWSIMFDYCYLLIKYRTYATSIWLLKVHEFSFLFLLLIFNLLKEPGMWSFFWSRTCLLARFLSLIRAMESSTSRTIICPSCVAILPTNSHYRTCQVCRERAAAHGADVELNKERRKVQSYYKKTKRAPRVPFRRI